MTAQEYRVIADRESMADESWIAEGDRVTYGSVSSTGELVIVRIERPVPSTDEPVHDATPEEIAASLIPSCGFDTEAYAQAHNDGWDAAVAQDLQDHPAAFAVALRAAADRIEQEQQPSLPTREQIAEAMEPDPADRDWQTVLYAGRVLALLQKGADRG